MTLFEIYDKLLRIIFFRNSLHYTELDLFPYNIIKPSYPETSTNSRTNKCNIPAFKTGKKIITRRVVMKLKLAIIESSH